MLAQPESGPVRLIDGDRNGGRGGSSLTSLVQSGARRHGIVGIHGNAGIGPIPFAEHIHVVNREIVFVRGYCDPRPMFSATNVEEQDKS